MRFVLRLLVGAGMCAGLLAVPACQTPSDADIGQDEDGALQLGSVTAADTVQRVVSPAGRPLVFDSFNGRIALRGTTATTASLTFVTRGRGANPTEAQETLQGVEVTETGTADTYTYELEADDAARSAVDVRGTVPHDAVVRIEQTSGSVALRGVRGRLDVQQRFGAIRVDGAAASVSASTQAGDVHVGMAAVPPDARLSLRTASGDVSLGLPPGASVQVDAQTNAGDIRRRGLAFTQERLTPVQAGARYTAQAGAGDAVATLRTEAGRITLEAAPPTDTTDAAPPPAPARAAPDTLAPDASSPADTSASPVRDTVPAPGAADTTAAPPDTLL
jgi:hypothetical protein